MNNKKILIIISVIIIVIVGCAIYMIKNNYKEDIQKQIIISVYNKENQNIYKENINTKKEHLIEVLKEIEELKIVTENSEYGEYINSIMEIEQGDNFYWTYYINDEYATTGVSNCKIQSEKEYKFKIEEIKY